MDDMAFPSHAFSKTTSKHTEFGESKSPLLCSLLVLRLLIVDCSWGRCGA